MDCNILEYKCNYCSGSRETNWNICKPSEVPPVGSPVWFEIAKLIITSLYSLFFNFKNSNRSYKIAKIVDFFLIIILSFFLSDIMLSIWKLRKYDVMHVCMCWHSLFVHYVNGALVRVYAMLKLTFTRAKIPKYEFHANDCAFLNNILKSDTFNKSKIIKK